MDFLFYNCASLTSLNLSNFDTAQVTWIESMFEGCSSLEYINLIKASENQILNSKNIFKGTPENLVICLNQEKTPNFIS
jgi:surface protein